MRGYRIGAAGGGVSCVVVLLRWLRVEFHAWLSYWGGWGRSFMRGCRAGAARGGVSWVVVLLRWLGVEFHAWLSCWT